MSLITDQIKYILKDSKVHLEKEKVALSLCQLMTHSDIQQNWKIAHDREAILVKALDALLTHTLEQEEELALLREIRDHAKQVVTAFNKQFGEQ